LFFGLEKNIEYTRISRVYNRHEVNERK